MRGAVMSRQDSRDWIWRRVVQCAADKERAKPLSPAIARPMSDAALDRLANGIAALLETRPARRA